MAAPKKKCLIALIRGCWFWFDKTSTQNFACWNQFVFVKPCWEKSRGLLKFSVCHFLSYLVFWQVVLRNGLKWVNIARCATNPWCDRRFCCDGMFWFSFTILSTKVLGKMDSQTFRQTSCVFSWNMEQPLESECNKFMWKKRPIYCNLISSGLSYT